MVRNIVSLIKYRKKNLYPIRVMYIDEYEEYGEMQKVLKYLSDDGTCVCSSIAWGTIFGYVLCEQKEIDEIIAKYDGNNAFSISRKPVDSYMKSIILG